MLLAGATAQRLGKRATRAAEMAMDRAAPFDPEKPEDLEGCVDKGVTDAKKLWDDEDVKLKALDVEKGKADKDLVEKLAAKKKAIADVIAEEGTAKDKISADQTAALEEIAARMAYDTAADAHAAAVKAVHDFNGTVLHEGDKTVGLVQPGNASAKGGKIARLEAAQQACATLATKYDTALKFAEAEYTRIDAAGTGELAVMAKKLTDDDLKKKEDDAKGAYDTQAAAVLKY